MGGERWGVWMLRCGLGRESGVVNPQSQIRNPQSRSFRRRRFREVLYGSSRRVSSGRCAIVCAILCWLRGRIPGEGYLSSRPAPNVSSASYAQCCAPTLTDARLSASDRDGRMMAIEKRSRREERSSRRWRREERRGGVCDADGDDPSTCAPVSSRMTRQGRNRGRRFFGLDIVLDMGYTSKGLTQI